MARTDTLGNFLTDVADAIRTKAGTSDPIQASTFDTAIANIPSGDSGWQRPSDWWDTETILANAENKLDDDNVTVYPAYILLLKDWDKTTTFVNTSSGTYPYSMFGDGYLTSDGSWYGTPDATHTWDTTQDKPCSEGYKTRYVIVYVKDKSSNLGGIILNKFKCIEAIFGDFTDSGFPYFGSTSSILDSNNYILNVKATANNHITSINRSYQFAYCANLKQVASPVVTTVSSGGGYQFAYCYSLEKLDVPNASVYITRANVFNSTYKLTKIIANKIEGTSGGTNVLKDTGLKEFISDDVTLVPNLSTSRNLEKVILPNATAYTVNNLNNCNNINELVIGKLNRLSNDLFPSLYNLKKFTVPSTVNQVSAPSGTNPQFSVFIEFVELPQNFAVSGMNLTNDISLTRTCLLDMLSKLKDVTGESGTYTLTLGATNLAKLTNDEIAVGTSKGWTIN